MHERTAGGSPQLVELRLARFGRGEALTEMKPGVVTSHEGRIEIRREGSELVEWYVNSADGLEQGFTLGKRPGGAAEREIVFELSVSGAAANRRGDGVALATPTRRKLAYGKLVATDAKGAKLSSRIEVPAPDLIRLVVADAGAVYPVTVDPLLAGAADTQLEGNQANASAGFGVASAGDVNGDGYADVLIRCALLRRWPELRGRGSPLPGRSERDRRWRPGRGRRISHRKPSGGVLRLVGRFIVASNPPFFWRLDYTGTFAGSATVTFTYDPATLAVPEDEVRIYHFADTDDDGVNDTWELPPQTRDLVANTVTLTVPDFSPFFLGADTACRNGVDDDGDGATDHPADPGCARAPTTTPRDRRHSPATTASTTTATATPTTSTSARTAASPIRPATRRARRRRSRARTRAARTA